jgi:hypothetical protein
MISEIIKEYNINKKLCPESLENLYKKENQLQLINYLQNEPDRDFAIYFLNDAITKRENKNYPFDLEDLMFASYLLAIHRNPEDALLIWKAKEIDFDTHCGHDIQLMVGGGVNETIAFLKGQKSIEAKHALTYLNGCVKAGDFDDIEIYYEERPWFL